MLPVLSGLHTAGLDGDLVVDVSVVPFWAATTVVPFGAATSTVVPPADEANGIR